VDLLIGLIVIIVLMSTGRRISLITIISMISMLGIKVGVGALICVLSVFNGFNGIVKGLLVGFDPHVRVTPVVNNTLSPDSLLPIIRKMPEVTAAAPYVSGRSVILHQEGVKAILIRGMKQADVNTAIGLGDKMLAGRFTDATPRIPHPMVLGAGLASKLRVSIGDTISILSQVGLEESLTQMAQPTTIQCVVTGTFSSNNKEYDAYYAYTDMGTARGIFGVDEGAMGIEIRLKDFQVADQVRDRLRSVLGPGYRAESWQDLHRDLFAVMELERWAAFIILSLIIIVAVFNVLGSLTMTVLEKRRDIGILKTMGASDRTILRTYLLEGGMIGVVGTLAGMVIGIGATLAQMQFGIFKLNNDVYMIPAIPVELRMADIVIISSTALLLALGAALYPAVRAARVLPAEAVRWE
ncbi:MAG: ABC transporter permease, partial [Bacteroidota bacterium]